MKLPLATAQIILILTALTPLYPAVINVPDDAETIQDGVNACDPGDTVLVSDGEYSGAGNVDILVDTPVVILSEGGPEGCIIDCENADVRGFEIRETVELRGFTVQDGDIGVHVAGVEQAAISDCVITGFFTLGVWIEMSEDVSVSNCVVSDNIRESEEQGAGVRIDDSAGLIDNCVIERNATLGSGAGLYASVSQVTISRTRFNDNDAGRYGGGLLITADSDITLLRCDLTANTCGQNGAGVAVTAGGTGTFIECVFEENASARSAGGLYISGSLGDLTHCFIIGNEAERNGGGMLCYNQGAAELVNCLFFNNRAGIDGGGISVSNASTAEVSNCDFVGNRAGLNVDAGMGGGLYKGSNSNPAAINSIFWGNESDIGNQLYAQDNGGRITIGFSCVEGGVNEDDNWDGEGIIDDDPLFTESHNPLWGVNNFFLDAESPCIDAGSGVADEAGMDTLTTQVNFSNDEDEVDLGFHYSFGWFRILGRLTGTVTDAASGDPLANAIVRTSRGEWAPTDEEGAWVIPEAPAMIEIAVTASLQGYNDQTEEGILLEEGEEVEIHFELTHPELILPDEALEATLAADDSIEVEFQIGNGGNGSLVWTAETRLPDEFVFDPWILRRSLPVGGEVNDARLHGAAFAEDRFFVAGAGAEVATIYIIERDGGLVGSYEQFGGARLGMRDLTWDGELLWGSGEVEVFGFTPGGDLIETFDGPHDPNTAISWDPARGIFWISGIATPIIGVDRDGNEQAALANPNLRIYGLANYPRDADGYELYIFHEGDNEEQMLTKMDARSGDTMNVAVFAPEGGGRPGGAFITSQFDRYSDVLLTIANAGDRDRIDAWQIRSRLDWTEVEPIEGTLEPDEVQDLTLSLNSTGMEHGVFEGIIAFTHNARAGESALPFTLEITDQPAPVMRTLDLAFGWNLVSLNVVPDDHDVRNLTRSLVDDGLLMTMKDQFGHFYVPEPDDFNNIEGWSGEQAYSIKLSARGRLLAQGMSVPADQPIQLREGWQWVSYYPRSPTAAEQAFEPLADELVIAKDGTGNFMAPEWGFNGLGVCREGKGYALRVASDVEFVWGGREGGVDFNQVSQRQLPEPVHFSIAPPTGLDMSLLVVGGEGDAGEIAAYAGGRLVGSGVIVGGKCGFSVRGDDPSTAEADGAVAGSKMELRWWDGVSEINLLEVQVLHGTLSFSADGFTVARMREDSFPRTFALSAAYPNPFNSSTRLGFSLEQSGFASLVIYDLSGRVVARVVEGVISAGAHVAAFNAVALPSGVLVARLESGGQVAQRKIVSLK